MGKILVISTLLLCVCFNFLFCKKERSCEECISGNKPPIAIAGPDQVITLPTDSISLDGSASNDPDGTISEWLWTKISGPASFNIISATTAKTVTKNLVAGTYQFELKVKDDKGLFAKDTMQVIVDAVPTTNHPPIANAGSDTAIILPANTINLDGSRSTDPDNNITSYVWTKILGPSSFNIANANAVQTQINNIVQGVYQFELKVTDAGGLFSKDTMQVNVNTQPLPPNNSCPPTDRPIINAQLIPVGNLSIGRYNMATVSAGNKLFFASGTSGSGNLSSRVDIYDISSQTWSTAQLSIPRWYLSAVAAGDKVFFAAPAVIPGPTPGPVTSQQALNGIFDSLSWTSWPGNLWCLQRFGGDIFLKHSYNSNFDSAYYNDHVRVFVKQPDALLWTNVPYDRGGQNNYSLYFTDDNYVVSFPPPLSVTINAPRILVLAKPAAPIDFSKKVSVKIIFV